MKEDGQVGGDAVGRGHPEVARMPDAPDGLDLRHGVVAAAADLHMQMHDAYAKQLNNDIIGGVSLMPTFYIMVNGNFTKMKAVNARCWKTTLDTSPINENS